MKYLKGIVVAPYLFPSCLGAEIGYGVAHHDLGLIVIGGLFAFLYYYIMSCEVINAWCNYLQAKKEAEQETNLWKE